MDLKASGGFLIPTKEPKMENDKNGTVALCLSQANWTVSGLSFRMGRAPVKCHLGLSD